MVSSISIDTDDSHLKSSVVKSHNKFFLRILRALYLTAPDQSGSESDPLFRGVPAKKASITQIPFTKALLKITKKAWAKAYTIKPMPKRLETLYALSGDDIGFLDDNPPPNSEIVRAVQSKAKTHPEVTANDKEGRKLDGVGKRIYSLSNFLLRTVNYCATLSAYQKFLWSTALLLMKESSVTSRSTAKKPV